MTAWPPVCTVAGETPDTGSTVAAEMAEKGPVAHVEMVLAPDMADIVR